MIIYDNLKEKIKEFIKEEKKWRAAGCPLRSAAEKAAIYNICAACEFFKKNSGMLPHYDKCDKCGCNLHKENDFLNKIAWATTKCPEGKW